MRLDVVMMVMAAKRRQTSGTLYTYVEISHRSPLLGCQKCLHQKTDSTGMVLGRIIEDLEQGTSRGGDNIIDIARDEEKDDEEDCAGECADADAVDHDLGAFDGGVGDFYRVSLLYRPFRLVCYLQSCEQLRPIIC